MIAFLSPAKNMKAASLPWLAASQPAFGEQTARLAEILKEYTPWRLEELMRINPTLALRAFEAFQSFCLEQEGSPALLAYHGLLYQNLDAASFTPKDFAFADLHLRVVSAFYGLLRPSDGILPYRLELQCRLKVDGKSLYVFWGDALCRALFAEGGPVVNLASGEYSRAVVPHLRPGHVLITCDFLVQKRGKLVMLPTAAKMARGQMARYIVKSRADSPEDLKNFDWGGYRFIEGLSSSVRYAFVADG